MSFTLSLDRTTRAWLRPYTPPTQLDDRIQEENKMMVSMGDLDETVQEENVHNVEKQDLSSTFDCSDQLESEAKTYPEALFNIEPDGPSSQGFEVFDDSSFSGMFENPAGNIQPEAAVTNPDRLSTGLSFSFL
jgi:hypothetical protein